MAVEDSIPVDDDEPKPESRPRAWPEPEAERTSRADAVPLLLASTAVEAKSPQPFLRISSLIQWDQAERLAGPQPFGAMMAEGMPGHRPTAGPGVPAVWTL